MASDDGLSRLGVDLDRHPGAARGEDTGNAETAPSQRPDGKDYFCERDGLRFAGTHLLVDLIQADRLDDISHIEQALEACVTEAGATLLHMHLHHFTPDGGVSGVAVLAESHISIHTWPEHRYAAVDVFMCGETDPHKAVDVLRRYFGPERLIVQEHLRGKESDLWTTGSTRPSMAASAFA